MKTLNIKLFVSLLLFLISPAAANAQTVAYYSGIVANSNNQPVENVTVSAAGAASVFSNTDGRFLLSFNEIIYDTNSAANHLYVVVYFMHPDYISTFKQVSIFTGDSLSGDTVILKTSSELPQLYKISGKALFQNGEPVNVGEIAFFNIDGNSEHNYFTFPKYPEGNYEITLPQGSYYVRSKATYKAESYPQAWACRNTYYNAAGKFEDADILKVSENLTDINFTHPVLSPGTISGKIIDARTYQQLGGVSISLTSLPLADSAVIVTDAEGNYSVRVFEGDYYIFAYKDGYKDTYYNQVHNIFEANPVSITSDHLNAAGIDFALETADEGTNNISGNVLDEETVLPIPDAEVIAISVTNSNPKQAGISSSINKSTVSQKTNNYGEYALRNIKNGSYLLLFYKDDYLSTFNGKSFEWEKAAMITLDGNANTAVDITLKKMNLFGGEISGNVIYEDSPISGALVSAVDETGKVIAANVSQHNGSYFLPSLKQGKYTLRVSQVGIPTAEYSQTIQIDLISSLIVNPVEVSLDKITSVKPNTFPKEYNLFQNYPNPFNPSTVISYQLAAGNQVSIKVYDLLGREVATLVNEKKPAGTFEVEFDGSNFSSGVYFYSLKAGDFLQTKKLILLK